MSASFHPTAFANPLTSRTVASKTSGMAPASSMSPLWHVPATIRPTAETPAPWLKTADVGYLDGYLYIVDRKKDTIVSGGFYVYPSEVENALSTPDAIREIAVVGDPSQRWVEEICAVVPLQPDASPLEADVISSPRSSIAVYKVPKQVRFVDDLTKSGAGKISKRVISDALWAGHQRRV